MTRRFIAPYITFQEYQCSCCGRLPPEFYFNGGGRTQSPPYLYSKLFKDFKKIREKWGRPIKITSGYRCLKRQKELYDQEISSAVISVHNFGLALDLQASDEHEVRSMVKLIRQVCPELRIGWQAYLHRGQSFIHVDVGYLINPLYSKKLIQGASW